jgi:hypothetical protein
MRRTRGIAKQLHPKVSIIAEANNFSEDKEKRGFVSVGKTEK